MNKLKFFERVFLGFLMGVYCLNMVGCNHPPKDHHHDEETDHGHTHSRHYVPRDSVENAKLLFPGSDPDRIILNLTEDPTHSLALNWRTSTEIKSGEVQVAASTHGPEFREKPRTISAETEMLTVNREEEPEISANYHSAIIDQLEPGEKYMYRVGKEPYWSEWFQVTMPSTDNSLSFIYFGDAQNDIKSMWSRVVREAYHTTPKVDFMLHAGDLINRHNRDVEWGEWFYAGSFIHATVPSVMTPGNHEYGDGVVLSPQWKPQFNLPKNGPQGLEETCYMVNYPELKVISLDAEQIDESEEFKAKQMNWLDSVLQNDPKKWTVITFHYPVFSTKPNRDNIELRENFKPIFDNYHVDMVLQGHDHAYGRGMVSNVSTGASVRDEATGTMYVVSVSGPKMYDVSEDPWMERKAGNTQLFQIIDIKGDSLTYNAFTAKGELYDSFELIKTGKVNKLVNHVPDTPERLKENK